MNRRCNRNGKSWKILGEDLCFLHEPGKLIFIQNKKLCIINKNMQNISILPKAIYISVSKSFLPPFQPIVFLVSRKKCPIFFSFCLGFNNMQINPIQLWGHLMSTITHIRMRRDNSPIPNIILITFLNHAVLYQF